MTTTHDLEDPVVGQGRPPEGQPPAAPTAEEGTTTTQAGAAEEVTQNGAT